VIDGRRVEYFWGASYYTLHAHTQVIAAACGATKRYGTGPGTTIDTPPIQEAVAEAARFFETDDVRCVASGYLADAMLAQALVDVYDVAFVDDRSHYSVLDAVHSTEKRVILFSHLDAADLAQKIKSNLRPYEIPLVFSDGVFPTTGVVAPLGDYSEVLSRYPNALLCVDDAHAVGVIGKKGQGSLEYCNVKGPNRLLAGTFSKAFGGLGGFVPCSEAFARQIDASLRIVEGASPPSTGCAAASAMGMRILREHPEMRTQLWNNVQHLRKALCDLGVDVGDSPVPIICIDGHPGIDLKRIHRALFRVGILVSYVPARSYSDAPSYEALRIAVFSTHSLGQLDHLIAALAQLL